MKQNVKNIVLHSLRVFHCTIYRRWQITEETFNKPYLQNLLSAFLLSRRISHNKIQLENHQEMLHG